MIKKANIFAFILILLSASVAFSQTNKPVLLKFADLQKYDPANETFRIEGYVIDIYKCPPCPPHAMCKPCIADNITIVDTDDWKDMSKLNRLRIYTDQTDKFVTKGKYLLTVQVKGNLAAGHTIEAVDLVSIERSSLTDHP